MRREAGKTFVNELEDLNIKIQLLLGGEQMANEALKQALELQAEFLAARPRRMSARTFQKGQSPTPPNRMKEPKATGALELWEARTLPG